MGVYSIGVYTWMLCAWLVLPFVFQVYASCCQPWSPNAPAADRFPVRTLEHSMVFASTPATGQCRLLIYSDIHTQTPLTHAELSASPVNALT